MFPSAVERWRPAVNRHAKGLPVDFLLAWIERESGGRPHVVSKLGERGLFQIHPGGERSMLKIGDEEWEKMRSPRHGEAQVAAGVRLVRLYSNYAKRYLADVNAPPWPPNDFFKLVKLHHGAFAAPKYTLLSFQRQHGRGPATWAELRDHALELKSRGVDFAPTMPGLAKRLRGLTPRIWNNAEEVGAVKSAPALLDEIAQSRLLTRILRLFM